MQMLVTPMRYRGKARSKHEVQTAEPVHGDLIVEQENSQAFGRCTNVARFHLTGAADRQLLSPLHDAQLNHMGPLGFVLTGFEVVDGVAWAQSWYCRLPD